MKAAVFVDVQNDFIDGALGSEKAMEIAPKIAEFAKECAENGYRLYATRDTHEKTKYRFYETASGVNDTTLDKATIEHPVGGYLTTLEGRNLPIEHCIEGTDGWMVDGRLAEVLDGRCTFVQKSAFGSFDLASVIEEDFFDTYRYVEAARCRLKCCARENDRLEEIAICGFATDICCVSCALLLRAKFPDVRIVVMKDLCAGTTAENHEAALKVMRSCQIEVL